MLHRRGVLTRGHPREVFPPGSLSPSSPLGNHGVEGLRALRGWKLNDSERFAPRGLRAKSSAVPSGAEGKQAGDEVWKLNIIARCDPRGP